MTETLEQRLVRHEGEKLKLYIDSRGFRSIGIGRNLDGRGITHDEAVYMLRNDIKSCQAELLEHLPWVTKLDDLRREILVEMVFQMGINGLLAFKNTLKHVQAGEWDAAADGMLASTWHSQTSSRAEEMAGIMRTGAV